MPSCPGKYATSLAFAFCALVSALSGPGARGAETEAEILKLYDVGGRLPIRGEGHHLGLCGVWKSTLPEAPPLQSESVRPSASSDAEIISYLFDPVLARYLLAGHAQLRSGSALFVTAPVDIQDAVSAALERRPKRALDQITYLSHLILMPPLLRQARLSFPGLRWRRAERGDGPEYATLTPDQCRDVEDRLLPSEAAPPEVTAAQYTLISEFMGQMFGATHLHEIAYPTMAADGTFTSERILAGDHLSLRPAISDDGLFLTTEIELSLVRCVGHQTVALGDRQTADLPLLYQNPVRLTCFHRRTEDLLVALPVFPDESGPRTGYLLIRQRVFPGG